MSGTDQIKQQYQKRDVAGALYNSVYSTLAKEERVRKTDELLKSYFKTREDKTILEIGAGQGHNVQMFESLGFKRENISLNELLPERIAAIKDAYPGLELFAGNALEIEFKKQFDIIYQSTVFTSILKLTDRTRLAKKMWEYLKPGGIILWYDFIYDNPRNPDVKKVSIEELKGLFPKADQHDIYRITLAPPIGRKVGKLYSLFNIPLLRSHILAAFRKANQ